jgi:hypothetical protein
MFFFLDFLSSLFFLLDVSCQWWSLPNQINSLKNSFLHKYNRCETSTNVWWNVSIMTLINEKTRRLMWKKQPNEKRNFLHFFHLFWLIGNIISINSFLIKHYINVNMTILKTTFHHVSTHFIKNREISFTFQREMFILNGITLFHPWNPIPILQKLCSFVFSNRNKNVPNTKVK